MNFKRRKRKSFVGCCALCMLRKAVCPHHRIQTRQEVRADEAEKLELKEPKAS